MNHSPAFSMADFSRLLLTADSLQAQSVWRGLLRMLHQDTILSFCKPVTESGFCPIQRISNPHIGRAQNAAWALLNFSVSVLCTESTPNFFSMWETFRLLNEPERDGKPQLRRHVSQGYHKVGVIDSHLSTPLPSSLLPNFKTTAVWSWAKMKACFVLIPK